MTKLLHTACRSINHLICKVHKVHRVRQHICKDRQININSNHPSPTIVIITQTRSLQFNINTTATMAHKVFFILYVTITQQRIAFENRNHNSNLFHTHIRPPKWNRINPISMLLQCCSDFILRIFFFN